MRYALCFTHLKSRLRLGTAEYFGTKEAAVQYAGTVKRHNACKRHVAIDTGVKQFERTFFLLVNSKGLNLSMLSSAFLKKLCQNC